MSASRARYLASKARREESEEEDYDSEEERYQRNQQRLLKKVEESASAIRALTKITRPFITGTWRLEREEQRQKNEALSESNLVSVPLPSKENQLLTSSLKNSSDSLWNDGTNISKSQSICSPIKHVKTTNVRSVLEMETVPSWRPLRKSKARQSLAQFNMENACKSPVACQDDVDSACKPLSECVTKASEELRTPLKAVATLNQAFERRLSSSQSVSSEMSTPSRRLSRSASQGSNDWLKTETKTTTYAMTENKVGSRNLTSQSFQTEPNIAFTDDQAAVTEDENFDQHHINDQEVGISQSLEGSSPLETADDKSAACTPHTNFIKTYKSPVRCSPILLQAFGEEYSKVRGSIVSPEKMVNLDECSSPKDPSNVLKDVVAYVEVRRGEDDRTGGFRWKLKQLGATLSETLNKKVTHVIFQEGLLSTFRKAKQLNTHLVSTHWVMACDESLSKVDEARYPIEKLDRYELADPLQKCIKRPKIMSPDLGSGRDEKVLSRRLQRRSVRLTTPLTLDSPKSHLVFKSPSPVKTERFLAKSWSSPKSSPKKSLPSPKTSPKKFLPSPKSSPKKPPKDSSADSDDDWDGFLAMVEAQVRQKAKSRRETGEISETPKDFETRLKQLLCGGEESATNKEGTSTPLASIFQRGKSPNSIPTKHSPKKTKKAKSTVGSAASCSVMMNWLKGRSPENGQAFEKRNLSSMSTVKAASAAAEEILQSMLKSRLTVDSEKDQSHKFNGKITHPDKVTLSKKTHSKNIIQEPFVFSAKPAVSKAAQPNKKKETKKNITDVQGSTASSNVMRNWLSGVKSPPSTINRFPKSGTTLPSVCSSPKITEVSKTPNKRKICELEVDSALDGKLKKLNGDKLCKRYCGEVTPKKQNNSVSFKSAGKLETPSKLSYSSKESGMKKTADLTPRRRSLRLTPIKCTSQPNSIVQLETVYECKAKATVSKDGGTPRKLSSRKDSSRSEQVQKMAAEKPATPNKYSKSQRMSLNAPLTSIKAAH